VLRTLVARSVDRPQELACAGIVPAVIARGHPEVPAERCRHGDHFKHRRPHGGNSLPPWVGLGVFALYTAVVLGAAAFALLRRDA
jgi:hypothetical protein